MGHEIEWSERLREDCSRIWGPIQVGAVRRGSAHGGASPLLFYSAGSGCPPGPKAQVSRVDSSRTTRVPSSRSVIAHFAHLLSLRGSPPSSCSPFPLLAILTILLHGPIQLPPRISPPSFARVSLRFLPFPSLSLRPVLSSFLYFVPHAVSSSNLFCPSTRISSG